jgi:hypothetical protein
MTGIKYIFREDEPLRIKAAGKADPQTIGEALAEIAEKAEGHLTPSAVVDSARSENHPLHPHFEWNDSAAAEAYRLDQARSIIRMVRVVDDSTNDGTTRAFLSVKDPAGMSYRSIGDVKSSLELQLAVLRQAERDLEAFKRRYREMTDICDLIEQAKRKLKTRLDNMETRKAA